MSITYRHPEYPVVDATVERDEADPELVFYGWTPESGPDPVDSVKTSDLPATKAKRVRRTKVEPLKQTPENSAGVGDPAVEADPTRDDDGGAAAGEFAAGPAERAATEGDAAAGE